MSRGTVLVVEDERIIAKGIEKQLRELGYEVAGLAATGESAVRMAAELRPDAVLMDIHLGAGMDGVRAADAIRAASDIPVVFLTAHSDDSTLERAARTEPFGFVTKPFDETDLHTALQVALYRHQAERRVRENEQWLAATLGSIGDGVIATDPDGRVRFLNGVASRLTGWGMLDASGADVRDVFRVVHEHTRAAAPNPALQAIAARTSVELAPDTILIHRDGTEWPIDDSAAPILDFQGQLAGAVLVFRDITERRRLEEHLRQAQKMEAIGRLAGGIAHDFNNIMTVITGFSELLLSGAVPAADTESALRQVNAAGLRAAALTRQIMAFSRKQALVPAVLSLNSVVRDTAEMVRRLIGSNIAFATEAGADLRWVKADPAQLAQVILNLCANARDAMPRGGRLELRTGNTDGGPGVPPGEYAVLSCSDTGTGMTAAVKARVFEPFFTTKEPGQGTGLGLASVQGTVTQCGGFVTVESEPGRGTTFRVYLPGVPSPDKPPSDHDTKSRPTGTETILLVDDDEQVRRMTRLMLEGLGYAVLEAEHGDDAARVAANAGPIHLLVTDMMMPGESGPEVAARLTAARPDLRVLFVSGYNEDVVADRGWAGGGVELLPKPFGLDALAAKVRAVLDRA